MWYLRGASGILNHLEHDDSKHLNRFFDRLVLNEREYEMVLLSVSSGWVGLQELREIL